MVGEGGVVGVSVVGVSDGGGGGAGVITLV